MTTFTTIRTRCSIGVIMSHLTEKQRNVIYWIIGIPVLFLFVIFPTVYTVICLMFQMIEYLDSVLHFTN